MGGLLMMRGVLEVIITWLPRGKLPFIGYWALQAYLTLILSVLSMYLRQTSILL